MSVYVDDMRAKFGRMIMCHMLADTPEELQAMLTRLGLNKKWIQNPGTPREHFDISLGLRAKAMKAGAVEITQRDMVDIIKKKRITPDSEGWFQMEGAPRTGTVRWVLGKLKDGSVVRMHYASDLSGEEQPAFQGWFERVEGQYFHAYHRGVDPVAWKPEPS